MKKPQANNEIMVDGIRYNVATGKVLEDQSLLQHSRSFDGIHSQQSNAILDNPKQKPNQVGNPKHNSEDVIDLPKRKRALRREKRTKKPVVVDISSPTFGSYVIKAFLPSGFSAFAWIFSVLRGVTSPLAWFLVALPLLVLSTQNLVYENINQLLEKAHQITENGVVFHASGAIIVSIVIAAIIIFVRLICNAIALHLRITALSGEIAKLWPASKLIFHNSLKILFHGAVQILFVGMASVLVFIVLFWVVLIPHGQTIEVFVPYIAGFILFVWFILLVLLHAKHWLQIAILSSSLKTKEIQRRSWQAVAAYPLRSGVLALVSFVLSLGIIVYGLWVTVKAIAWLNRSTVPSNTRFILLMSSIFLGVVLVGYLQQTIWSAYASWLNIQYKPRLFVLAKESEIKKTKLWPIWVSSYLFVMILALFVLSIIYILP